VAPTSAVAAERLTDGSEAPLSAPLRLAHDRLAAHALANGVPVPRPWSEGVGWEACCPAHHDKNASLSIGQGDSVPVVATCHAGCELPEIAAALGIDRREFSHAGFERSSSGSNSWAPVDLEPIIAAVLKREIVGPIPTLLPRTDGQCLLYPGEIHSLSGEPDIGKGWIVLFACAVEIKRGNNVLYLDFEDGPASIVGRLVALGVDPAKILKHFFYSRPVDPFEDRYLAELLDARLYTLATVDGLTEAYELLGLDPLSNKDAAKFLARVPRPIAHRGAAVVEIDHVNRNPEQRGRYAYGAQHKLAGIGVAYSVQAVPGKALSRQQEGLIKVSLSKDRHGHIGKHGPIALVRIIPENDGEQVTVFIKPPDDRDATGKVLRPTALMAKTSRMVEETPGMTWTQIRSCVGGNTEAGELALRILIDEQYVTVKSKINKNGTISTQGARHHHVKPYTKAEENGDVSAT
jgi:hypothetical protein